MKMRGGNNMLSKNCEDNPMDFYLLEKIKNKIYLTIDNRDDTYSVCVSKKDIQDIIDFLEESK